VSSKKTVSPLYLESAEIVALQNNIGAMRQFNESLVRIIAENLPSTGPQLGKLREKYLQSLAQIESTRAHMIFEGRGTRGMALASAIRTETDRAKYEALLRRPLAETVDLDPLSKLIDNLFGLTDAQGNNGWLNLPMISDQHCPLEPITKPAPEEDIEVRAMEDGVYLTDQHYELIVKVDDDTTLLFNPINGLRFVSFCPAEDANISHVCANYLDVEKACAAVQGLMTKAGLRDITIADRMELHRVAALISPEHYATAGVVRNGKEFSFTLAENYVLTTNARGVGKIEERPDATKWEDLTLLTRRYLYQENLQRLKGLIEVSSAK